MAKRKCISLDLIDAAARPEVVEWDPKEEGSIANHVEVPRDHRGRFKPASIGDWDPDRDSQKDLDAKARSHQRMIDGMRERMGLPKQEGTPSPREHRAVEKPIVAKEPRPIVQPPVRAKDPRPDLPRDRDQRLAARQAERDRDIARAHQHKFHRHRR